MGVGSSPTLKARNRGDSYCDTAGARLCLVMVTCARSAPPPARSDGGARVRAAEAEPERGHGGVSEAVWAPAAATMGLTDRASGTGEPDAVCPGVLPRSLWPHAGAGGRGPGPIFFVGRRDPPGGHGDWARGPGARIPRRPRDSGVGGPGLRSRAGSPEWVWGRCLRAAGLGGAAPAGHAQSPTCRLVGGSAQRSGGTVDRLAKDREASLGPRRGRRGDSGALGRVKEGALQAQWSGQPASLPFTASCAVPGQARCAHRWGAGATLICMVLPRGLWGWARGTAYPATNQRRTAFQGPRRVVMEIKLR